jgi:hypothetical protein
VNGLTKYDVALALSRLWVFASASLANRVKCRAEKRFHVAIESTGHEGGNPRMYALVEDSPKEGPTPTVWAWPQFIDFLKVAGQPVQGPWPPHQEPRPDPDADSLPVAVRDDHS